MSPLVQTTAVDVDSILRNNAQSGGFFQADIGLTSLLINLVIGLAIALVLRWHFIRFGAVLANRRQFARVFPFVLLTTLVIITVVKSSLALSLGLVGALSIVRFRTPIKEPEELAYLFLCISAGLGLGANQVGVSVVGTAFILAAVTALSLRRGPTDPKALYLNISAQVPQGDAAALVERINSLLAEHVDAVDLRRLDATDGRVDLSYHVDFPSPAAVLVAVRTVEQNVPDSAVTVIDQSNLMAM